MKELVIIEKDEIRELVREIVREENRKTVDEADFKQRMNRKEAAVFLGVSYQTLGKWTQKGWVTMYGQGRKRYYLKGELLTLSI